MFKIALALSAPLALYAAPINDALIPDAHPHTYDADGKVHVDGLAEFQKKYHLGHAATEKVRAQMIDGENHEGIHWGPLKARNKAMEKEAQESKGSAYKNLKKIAQQEHFHGRNKKRTEDRTEEQEREA